MDRTRFTSDVVILGVIRPWFFKRLRNSSGFIRLGWIEDWVKRWCRLDDIFWLLLLDFGIVWIVVSFGLMREVGGGGFCAGMTNKNRVSLRKMNQFN